MGAELFGPKPTQVQRDSMTTERSKRKWQNYESNLEPPRAGRMFYQLNYPVISLLRHMTHILLGHNKLFTDVINKTKDKDDLAEYFRSHIVATHTDENYDCKKI